MAFVTFIPRVIPLMILSRFTLPEWAMRWLHYVPISVIAALIGQEIFMLDGQLTSFKDNIELFAAIPTFIIAMITRSLFITVISGMFSVIILQLFF